MTMQQYREILNEESQVAIEMVLIPSGKFLMGSPDEELGRTAFEGPQHEVMISNFFMSRYPITQAQWKLVATMPDNGWQLNPQPSDFDGDNRPVEMVSWQDALEFCTRLSTYTGHPYRLPTESEWEYACRAGTTTPFCFGDQITPDLVNYRAPKKYPYGPKAQYPPGTTSVDHFDVTNSFGLSDMHGNVYEWCQDDWHENYENAPIDGSAWLLDTNERISIRVIRGGSWRYRPDRCRSANRNYFGSMGRTRNIGFRVVSSSLNTR
ncbi:formylglycine-generating enzyme family protein [Leptolyngbyaceae cyanobacterium CCMR0081]|uniref:Formylglycine-generating enzyme family protein n=1 Tax=Adonisia turfae CCMR0081 TaxID=2292702 RepID=A0A6M0RE66_9CYAN|nr:formylglycine-generating enzyme family protein [Adonisia turfae CCMR0081]